jgi:hypothetical protein
MFVWSSAETIAVRGAIENHRPEQRETEHEELNTTNIQVAV